MRAITIFSYRNGESDKKWVCYYCAPELKRQTEQEDKQQYIVCFITEEHRQLDVYPCCFNSFLTSELVILYYLDESISNFRGFW